MKKYLIPIIIILFINLVCAVEYSDVVSPSISLEMERTNYGLGDSLEGNVILEFEGPLFSDIFTLFVFNETYELTLTEVLDKLNESYTEVSAQSGIGDPTTEVTLNEGDIVAIQVPRYSEIKSVSMDISGASPTFPYLDFGGEGYIHWYYLGEFLNYAEDYTTPTYLGDTSTGTSTINNGETYYCEVIDFDYSKNFEVYAKYETLVTGTSLKATILSLPGGDPVNTLYQGGSDTCSLPENSELGWGSCEIELEYAAQGNYLVCVYVDGEINEDAISLAIETDDSTYTAYACPIEEGYCTLTSPTDFFIKVKTAEYDGTLDSSATFSNWYTFYNAPIDGINYYVGGGGYEGVCEAELCAVPIVMYAESDGDLILSNPEVVYESASVTQTTNSFYQFIEQNAYISHISVEGELEEITSDYVWSFEFPLSFFDVTTSQELDNGLYTLELKYLDEAITTTLNVSSEYEVEEELTTAEQVKEDLDQAITSLENLRNEGEMIDNIISMTGYNIEAALSTLEDYQITLNSLIEDSEIEELQSEIDSYLADYPKYITVSTTIDDEVLIEPNTVKEVIGEDYEDVYFYQKDFNIIAKITKFTIYYFDGTSGSALYVEKKIKALENANQVNVYEIIDKEIASSIDELMFEETPTTIEEDPIVKWYLSKLNAYDTQTYSYIINTEADINLEGLKTIIVPTSGVPIDAGTTTCGDGICTVPLETKSTCPSDCGGLNWWLFIVIGIVFVILLYYINWYRGKWNFKQLTRGKNPFNSKQELKSVVNYIKTMLTRGTNKETIIDNLKHSGWKRKQIDYAFEELKLEKKIKKIPKKAANNSALKNYITAAIQKGLSEQKIKANLLRVGWNKEQVSQAYDYVTSGMKKKLSVTKWTFGLFKKKNS